MVINSLVTIMETAFIVTVLLAMTANYLLWFLFLLNLILPAPVVDFGNQLFHFLGPMVAFNGALLCLLLPPKGVGWDGVYNRERQTEEEAVVEDEDEESEPEDVESEEDEAN